jgi:hypothetical protein
MTDEAILTRLRRKAWSRTPAITPFESRGVEQVFGAEELLIEIA